MRTLFFLAVFLLSACLPLAAAERVLPPPTDPGFIYFTADEATVSPDEKTVNLTGNVTLIQKTPDGKKHTITGQNITFDQPNTTITSVGPITISDDQGTYLEGQNVSANYTTQEFQADQLTTEYPPLRVLNAQEIASHNGTQVVRKATLTCCDKPDPHYTVSVGKVSISPKKRAFMTNAVFKLDGFPIFYLPVFWRSLDSQKPWTTYVEFTQSDKVGLGVLTTSVFRPVIGLRPTLNLDYYTKSGLGLGAGLTAVESPTLRGSGEYYYIDDQNADYLDISSHKRWGLQGGYWWEMYDSSDHFANESGALYQFQTQFRKVSDPYFNDTFFRSNPYIFMPDQQTNFSISRQTRRSTLRINYQEKDIFVWDKKEFLAEKRVLPEIKYMQLPFNDPLLNLSHRFEVDFNNTSSLIYTQGQPSQEGPYQRQAHAKWTMEKSLRLGRGATFTPSAYYDQTVTFADTHYQDRDAWLGRIGTTTNLQLHSVLGSTDIGHQFVKRLSTGTLSSDHFSEDKGIEQNRLYITHYYRPSFQTYVRFGSGFNLSDYKYDLTTGYGYHLTWDHLKKRIEPILVEWGYNSPSGVVNFFVQDQYDLDSKNISFIAQSTFNFYQQQLSLGLNNFADHIDPSSLYETNADRYTLTTLWGLRPASNTWQADVGIDAAFFRGSLTGFNKLLRLSRTFHDARLDVTLRHRNHNFSFAFRINIICGGTPRTEAAPEDTYWYPWRQAGDLRD